MGREGGAKGKGMGDENMRGWDSQVGGGVGWKSKERDISIEGSIMGETGCYGNSQESTRMIPEKTPSNSREGV